jgi:hypothetical protein
MATLFRGGCHGQKSKDLKGASFQSIDQLRETIEAFVEFYQANAKPFVWRKREVKGS